VVVTQLDAAVEPPVKDVVPNERGIDILFTIRCNILVGFTFVRRNRVSRRGIWVSGEQAIALTYLRHHGTGHSCCLIAQICGIVHELRARPVKMNKGRIVLGYVAFLLFGKEEELFFRASQGDRIGNEEVHEVAGLLPKGNS
jgi:hypothetical protein